MTDYFLLAGLGNLGDKYRNNRHNVGFMAVDIIRERFADDFSDYREKHNNIYSSGEISGKKIILAKPQKYMNLSGEALRGLVKFYKIPLERIFIFHDEADIDLGRVKCKTGGGSGGHNGIKDLDSYLSAEYHRVRIGVGHSGNPENLADYVLSDFADDELARIAVVNARIAESINKLLTLDFLGYCESVADVES